MSFENFRVLVVDDFDLGRERVRGALLEMGFDSSKIEEAEDGKPALELLRQASEANKPFHLVLCDWTMPGMTGLELLKACRADEKLSTTKFIMVTAEAETSSVIEALKAGADDYITKPVMDASLASKVSKVLKK